MERFKWCNRAVEQIKFKPDRNEVWEELSAHIEDRCEVLRASGLTEKEAEARAVAAMGDPEEVGRQLNAVHKPWLGWLWRISKWFVVVLLIAAIAASVWFSLEGKHYLFWDETDAHFTETELEEERFVRGWQLNTSDKSDGYTFVVDEAALWESKEGYTFYLNLRVMTVLPPWGLCIDTVRSFELVDNQGDSYECYGKEGNKIWNLYGKYVDNSFVIVIPDFDPTIQWVQLHYTRVGRNVILPFSLSGGETP